MKVPVKKVFFLFYLGLFLFFISQSVIKFFNRSTVYISNLKDEVTIQYPSVSVCPRYTSKNGSIASFLSSNATLTEKKKKIFESIWTVSYTHLTLPTILLV